MPEAAPHATRLYPAVREHLEALSDEIGIMQHAVGPHPDPRHGYCTDDVARALLVDVAQAEELGWPVVAASVARALRFLEAAFEPGSGRFRNFRDATGAWLPGPPSEDAHARGVQALGTLVARCPDAGVAAQAASLLGRALPAAAALQHPRPQAAALLGCDAALAVLPDAATRAVHGRLATALWAAVGPAHADGAWPWPGATLTYENGLLPRALIVAGVRLGDDAMVARGTALVAWLDRVQTAPQGHLSLIGNAGWWPRGDDRARFDQQPIDATALLLAADAAHAATGEARHEATVERCYGWFLGRNDLGCMVALPASGACQDGLTPSGANPNQGAESTLMWLLAAAAMRRRRPTRAAGFGDAVRMDKPT